MREQLIQLDQIHTILIVIAVFLLIAGISKLFQAISTVSQKFKKLPGGIFASVATDMYEAGKFEELMDFCNEELCEKPNNPYAHWLLARAHYGKGEYEKAKIGFADTLKLRPLWRAEWVEPYLDQIKIQDENH